MTDRELLIELTIPKYKRTFIQSNSIRQKNFEKGKKQLPLKYCNQALYESQGIREPDGVNYFWQPFPRVRQKKKKFIDLLVNKEGKLVVANEAQVGQRRIKNINGQAIYNNNIARHDRNNMIGQIKDQLRSYMIPLEPIKRFPLIIEVDIYDSYIDDVFSNGQNWDVGNRFFPYAKAFEDMLTELKIIPDDHRGYITGPPRALFCPLEDPEDRKFICRVYKDNRPIVLNSYHYQKLLGDKLK